MEFPRLGGKVPLEDEPDSFAEPRTREGGVTIGVIAIGGVGNPVRVMLRVGVVLFEKIDSLFSSFAVVVGWPREIFVGGIGGDSEEVMPLDQSFRESMDGDVLETGRRGDELKDIIDVVLLDVRGIRLWRRVDLVELHSCEREVTRSETS